MRFPSLALVASEAQRAFLRFPLVLLCSWTAGVAFLLLVEDVGSESVVSRLSQVAVLGIPLFFTLRLFDERWRDRWSRAVTTYLLPALGAAVLVALYVAWDGWLEPVMYRRLVQLVIGLHLLVAFAPWIGRGTLNGFWQYNRALFLRFVTAALFSGVLYLGLSVALVALDQLFGVPVQDQHYVWLWLVVAFVFNTWYFLGGVPRDLSALDVESQYPTALRIFSQYILLPIVVVYLGILSAYIVKILFTRSWPSGWIGYLVSSVSVLGILSLLLVHPIRERAEQAWIRTYARAFYAALLPSIAMLWVAIWKRIDQYGVTENRYFLAVIAMWLAGIALFYLLRQSRNIRVIPVTLCILAFGTFLGPWSAYRVSYDSQIGRLEGILKRNDMLQAGRVQPAAAKLSAADRRQMSSILVYVLSTHGTSQLEKWFGGAPAFAAVDTFTTESAGRGQAWQRAERVMAAWGTEYVHDWQSPDAHRFNFFQNAQHAVRITGYDLVLHQISGHSGQAFAGRIRVEEDVLEVRVDLSLRRVRIARVRGGVGDGEPWIDFGLEALFDEIARRAGDGPPGADQVNEPLHVEWSDGPTRVLLDVRSVSGRFVDGEPRIGSIQVDVYLTDPQMR